MQNGDPSPESRDQPWISSPLRSRAARTCLSHSVPSWAPVGKLVTSIPAPRSGHRQHENPALAQQVMIDTRIVDFFGRMGEVEFHRPTATLRRSMNSNPFYLVSTLPGCGSPTEQLLVCESLLVYQGADGRPVWVVVEVTLVRSAPRSARSAHGRSGSAPAAPPPWCRGRPPFDAVRRRGVPGW